MPEEEPEDIAIAFIRSEIAKTTPTEKARWTEKLVLAALGCIPWIGGFICAAMTMKTEDVALHAESLQNRWLEEHGKKIKQLMKSLESLTERLAQLGPEIEDRIQSESYLALVRQAFRTWDQSETEEKRRLIVNLIGNAGGTRLCSDDVVRLFIDWVELYHESHFAMIGYLAENPGSTRYEMWTEIYGVLPKDNSAEADLFKLLIHDLSTGRVLRQARDTNEIGQFIRKNPVRRKASKPTTLESPFEDTKQYVLTELGQQFVHYTMNEVVTRID